MEDSSNILGFSMFNTSHPFYPEFVRSLNMSWRENCEASTYPGPAVSSHPCSRHTGTQTLPGPLQALAGCAQNPPVPHSLSENIHEASQCGPELSLTPFFLSTSQAAPATWVSSRYLCCPNTCTPQGLCTCSSCCFACTSPGN